MKEAENFAKYPTQPYRHSHNWVSDIAADMHLILVLPGYWSKCENERGLLWMGRPGNFTTQRVDLSGFDRLFVWS